MSITRHSTPTVESTSFEVKPPFTSQQDADIILRSCDGQQFFVHHIILSLVSPVFRDMFDAMPPQPSSSSLQIVDVEESFLVLDCLLRICYPVSDPKIDELPLEQVEDCLRAAHKYEMGHCTRVFDSQLYLSTSSKQEHMFALACRWNLTEVAEAAASSIALSLRIEHEDEFPDSPEDCDHLAATHPGSLAAKLYLEPEMRDIPAGSFYRLLSYAYAESRDWSAHCNIDMHMCTDINRTRTEAHHSFPFNPPGLSTFPDVVVKSCDGIAFNVHRDILSKTSSILPNSIPSETSRMDRVSGSPCTVDVVMDSTLLSPLLQLCYDSESFSPTSSLVTGLAHAQAEAVYLMALKHRVVRANDFMAAWLRHDLDSKPLRVYLMSARLGLPDVAQEAAVVATQRNLAYSYDPELENTEARHYFALLQFSYDYQEAFMAVVGDEKLAEAARKQWPAVCDVLAAGSGDDASTGGPDAALAFVQGGMKNTGSKANVQNAKQSTTEGASTTRRSKRLRDANTQDPHNKISRKASAALAKSCIWCYFRTMALKTYARIKDFSATVAIIAGPHSHSMCSHLPQEIRRIIQTALDNANNNLPTEVSSLVDSDARSVLDEMWRVLDSPATPTAARGGSPFSIYRTTLRKVTLKLALKHDILPGSLILMGVVKIDDEQHGAGSFSDVFCGIYQGRKVALKK
ncbi:hypothetical protein EUX98_g1656 [Antrodiella citrinella]|uniref:BTB domain-containing protein n=1 Tax=Antrodiella citrinella TaxID=2447956 RepID=A0A4S4N0W3_9APHY|nr:hypothetical protein EUX98_g1656 [Antrodiella citrinella]